MQHVSSDRACTKAIPQPDQNSNILSVDEIQLLDLMRKCNTSTLRK